MPLTFPTDGAQYIPAALDTSALAFIETVLASLPAGQPGLRLASLPELGAMLGPTGAVGRHAAAQIGPQAKPVRAILFDKNPAINWALGWHQDRTIAVKTRIDTPGFGPWTIKAGICHVAPRNHCSTGC